MAKFIQRGVGDSFRAGGSLFSMLYALDEDGTVWWYSHGDEEWNKCGEVRDGT